MKINPKIHFGIVVASLLGSACGTGSGPSSVAKEYCDFMVQCEARNWECDEDPEHCILEQEEDIAVCHAYMDSNEKVADHEGCSSEYKAALTCVNAIATCILYEYDYYDYSYAYYEVDYDYVDNTCESEVAVWEACVDLHEEMEHGVSHVLVHCFMDGIA